MELGNMSKEDAADALGITVSGAYKLLRRMPEQGLLAAHEKGKQRIYGRGSNRARYIETSDRLDRKIVAFTGLFLGRACW